MFFNQFFVLFLLVRLIDFGAVFFVAVFLKLYFICIYIGCNNLIEACCWCRMKSDKIFSAGRQKGNHRLGYL